MKIIHLPVSLHIILVGFITIFFFLPSNTSASTVKPTCELTVQTSRGTEAVAKDEEVLLIKGEEIEVSWESRNAKKAFNVDKEKIELDGSSTSSPLVKATYVYYFENGSKKVSCEVTVVVAEGSINNSSLVTSSRKPQLNGKVSDLKTVQVSITKEGSTKPVFLKKAVKVKNGKWTVKVTKKLQKGTYTLSLLGDKDIVLNTIATGTLTVGITPSKAHLQSTTFVAEIVPLLVGGQAKSNATMPVLYLQVINIGKTPGTIKSFEVKQNGSAQADVVVGLSIANEIMTNGSIKAEKGKAIFKNSVASIPVDITIAPQQMQLFTLKATVGTVMPLQIGKQIKLDISSIVTDGKMQSVFPILGTTWIVAG